MRCEFRIWAAILSQLDSVQRSQGYRTEQAGIELRPVGRVERTVAPVDDIDVVKIFPIDFAPVEIGDAVGGEVGDVDLQQVFSRAKPGSDRFAERGAPKSAELVAVEPNAGAFADPTEVQPPVVGACDGCFEFDRIPGGAGKTFGFGIAQTGPGIKLGGLERGG